MTPQHERLVLYVVVWFLALVVGCLAWYVRIGVEPGAVERPSPRSTSVASEIATKRTGWFDQVVKQAGRCSSNPDFGVFAYLTCVVKSVIHVIHSQIGRSLPFTVILLSAILSVFVRQAVQGTVNVDQFR